MWSVLNIRLIYLCVDIQLYSVPKTQTKETVFSWFWSVSTILWIIDMTFGKRIRLKLCSYYFFFTWFPLRVNMIRKDRYNLLKFAYLESNKLNYSRVLNYTHDLWYMVFWVLFDRFCYKPRPEVLGVIMRRVDKVRYLFPHDLTM